VKHSVFVDAGVVERRAPVATFLAGAEIQGLGTAIDKSCRQARPSPVLVGLSPSTSIIMSASLAPECNEVKEYVHPRRDGEAELTLTGNTTTAS
jgi:hypothetical protein